jgi:hypothetical protein
VSFVLMTVAARRFGSAVVALLRAIAPDQVPEHGVRWPMVWLGVLVQFTLMPLALMRVVLEKERKDSENRVTQIVYNASQRTDKCSSQLAAGLFARRPLQVKSVLF